MLCLHRTLALACASFIAMACGKTHGGSDALRAVSDDPPRDEEQLPADEAAPEVAASEEGAAPTTEEGQAEAVRLKGAALLSRTFVDVLGPNADVNIFKPSEHLFLTYQGNFGGNEGLNYGSVYANSLGADNPMTSYFMGLSYIAYNAGLQCRALATKTSPCRCNDQASAIALLGRAIPYIDFTAEDQADLVNEFVALCKEDDVFAISSLMASVAVAKRN